MTNALEPPKAEGGDALEANQDKPNVETMSKDLAPTGNGDNGTVRFVLSSVGDKFDNSLDDNIYWESTKENNKATGVIRVIRAEIIGNHVPRQLSNNQDEYEQNKTENEATVSDINGESKIEDAENVGLYNDEDYADYDQLIDSDTLL